MNPCATEYDHFFGLSATKELGELLDVWPSSSATTLCSAFEIMPLDTARHLVCPPIIITKPFIFMKLLNIFKKQTT
jgi:hypothetical protein